MGLRGLGKMMDENIFVLVII